MDDGHRVFGMVDVSNELALGYVEIVPQRNAATLLTIIQAHIRPGTVIHSDQWAAYNHVSILPGVAGHQSLSLPMGLTHNGMES